jgi:hypothetical protein
MRALSGPGMVTYHACKFTYSIVTTTSQNSEYFPANLLRQNRPHVHGSRQTQRRRNLISELSTGPDPGPAFQRHLSWYAVISASRGYTFNCPKAPKAKNPNPSGLGRAIINRRAKDAHQTEGSNLVRSGRITIEGSQPCLLVHNRHRSLLSIAICHPGRGSRRILEYGTISRHRIYCR